MVRDKSWVNCYACEGPHKDMLNLSPNSWFVFCFGNYFALECSSQFTPWFSSIWAALSIYSSPRLWLFSSLVDMFCCGEMNFTYRKKHLHTAVFEKTRSLISGFVKFSFCECMCPHVCVSFLLQCIYRTAKKSVMWETHKRSLVWIEPLNGIYFCTYREKMFQERQALL